MLRAAPVIGTMRVRTRRADSAALRLAIERQLPSDAFQARGIGPSAILLIRRMADPLPGAVIASEDWKRALQGRIDSLCSAAARPDRGRIAAGAEAILLADEAELLACLALELALGAPPSWWRLAIARYLNGSRLPALCRAQLPLLPAVFVLLARWERLDEVVQALSAEEALELCALFAAANDLHTVANIVLRYHAETAASEDREASARESAAQAEDVPASRPDVDAPSPAVEPIARKALPRIDSWIPASSRARAVPHRLLMALLLGFREQPAVVSSARFAAELKAWLRGVATTTPAAGSNAEPTHAAALAPPTSAPLAEAAHSHETAPPPAHREASAPEEAVISADTADPRVAPDIPMAESAAAERDPLDGLGIVTELGGVFCLINVLEHLGLPDCFQEKCRLASSVGAFGTLEAIARVLVGTLGEELRHDPIWAVLAALDGREPHSPPRARGLRTRSIQLPEQWRDSIDVGISFTLDESQARAIEALRREGWSPALLHWLALTIPYINGRIAQACGLLGDSSTRMLLELPARVYVTEAHIDVVASIENIRVPIRLAGLDRSPGWVRSLQRIVLIHFE